MMDIRAQMCVFMEVFSMVVEHVLTMAMYFGFAIVDPLS
jgi:hypothetical protein